MYLIHGKAAKELKTLLKARKKALELERKYCLPDYSEAVEDIYLKIGKFVAANVEFIKDKYVCFIEPDDKEVNEF